MIYLIIGIGALAIIYYGLQAFVATDPAKLRQLITWFLGSLAVVGVVLALFMLILSDRLFPLLIVAPTVAPYFIRLWRRWRGGRGSTSSSSSSSNVETTTLSMRLDHTSGTMTGTVKIGPYAGRHLDELDETQLFEVLHYCRVYDEDAARLLEAWLDRSMPNWRQRTSAGSKGNAAAGDAMTRDEALAILGLKQDAAEADILAAHRRLIMKLHPDLGGTTYLAAKLNRAKDVLLG